MNMPRMVSQVQFQPPILPCRELPALPSIDLAELQRTFASTVPCPLRQAWLPTSPPHFAPATVRTAWHADSLLVFAELTDRDIYTNATTLNQKTWELGDAFEMFFRPVEQTAYAEFHVVPNNHRLQLRIPNEPALRASQKSGVITPFLMPGEAIHSTVWLRIEEQRWWIYARIPAASVYEKSRRLLGAEWKFSFSRYDYTRGQAEPAYSSTSPHPVLDYHRQADWGTLHFQPRS